MNRKIVNGTVKHLTKAIMKEAEGFEDNMSYENLKALEDIRALLSIISVMNDEIENIKRENHKLKTEVKD